MIRRLNRLLPWKVDYHSKYIFSDYQELRPRSIFQKCTDNSTLESVQSQTKGVGFSLRRQS